MAITVHFFGSFYRLQATEVQVAQYQAEIAGLEKARLQLDEYKKKADVKSRYGLRQ